MYIFRSWSYWTCFLAIFDTSWLLRSSTPLTSITLGVFITPIGHLFSPGSEILMFLLSSDFKLALHGSHSTFLLRDSITLRVFVTHPLRLRTSWFRTLCLICCCIPQRGSAIINTMGTSCLMDHGTLDPVHLCEPSKGTQGLFPVSLSPLHRRIYLLGMRQVFVTF